jgi:hypothetical protein
MQDQIQVDFQVQLFKKEKAGGKFKMLIREW